MGIQKKMIYNFFKNRWKKMINWERKLFIEAESVLEKNWRGYYTCPSILLYPHQWSWDSAFVSMGYAHYDQQKAEIELLSLFEGQWKNGLLPHIIFHQGGSSYFPGPSFWDTNRNPNAPTRPITSGIVQPPIHATAALYIYKHASNIEEARLFLTYLYPRLVEWHQYLYRERDPHKEGLVYIRHPWESGQDNSPIWDEPLKKIPLKHIKIPRFRRIDNKLINESERPRDEDYQRYIFLLNIFRDCEYEEECMRYYSPFLIQDVLFNSLLCKSNRELAEIAKIVGKDGKPWLELSEWTAQAIENKLWDEKHNIYVDYDIVNQNILDVHIASGFMPLYASIPDSEKIQKMYEYLNTVCFCQLDEGCYAIPSYDTCGEGFSTSRYWRGPIWLNINWLLSKGLKNSGFTDYVDKLDKSIIALPIKHGFYEYFDPVNNQGLGTPDFSWSAALFIDVLATNRNVLQQLLLDLEKDFSSSN